MPDLRERFESTDLIPVDDVWTDVTARLEDADDARPLRFGGPSSERIGWKKVVTIAAAFAIAVASIAIAIRAFRSAEEKLPASGAATFGQVRGWIACGGQPLTAIDPDSSPGSLTGQPQIQPGVI